MSAEFRSVQTRMWRDDEWFQNLATDERLLFIYLFTNPSADVSGIYRLPFRTLAFESGIEPTRAREILDRFAQDGKAFYEDGVMWVVRMRENQLPAKRELSATIQTHIENEIAKIPHCRVKQMYLRRYGYPTDTQAQDKDTLLIPYTIPYGGTVTVTDTVTDTYTGTVTDSATVVAQPIPPTPKRSKPVQSTEQQEMFGAVATVCVLNQQLKAAEIGRTAASLVKAGFTVDQVLAFREWWEGDEWRASHTPTPTMRQLLEKIQQSTSTNGRPPTRPTTKLDRSLAAVDEVFAMIQAQQEMTP